MRPVFTYYSIFFLITGLFSLFVAFVAWQRRNVKAAKELTILMIAAGLWATINTFESSGATQSIKMFWSQVEYFISALIPIIYLIFTARFTNHDKIIRTRNILLLLIIPLITIVLAVTSHQHPLLWTGFSEIKPETNLMEYHHGIWFWTGFLGYNYLIFIYATVLLLIFIYKHHKTFRSQGWIVLIAGFGPWVASIMYVTDTNPVAGLNIAPASMSMSGLLFLIAILYVRFLDLVPVAREILVETLTDGIMALDNQNRIQDINTAALDILGFKNNSLLGVEFNTIEIKSKLLQDSIISPENINNLVLDQNSIKRHYKIIKEPIKEHSGSRVIIIRDITEQIQQQLDIDMGKENYQNLYTTFRLMSDTMPDMIWAKNLKREYIFVNKALCKIILNTIDIEEPIGKTEEYFFQRNNTNTKNTISFHEQSIKSDEITLRHMKQMQFEEYGYSNGKYLYLEVHKAPLFNNQHELIGIIGSARDITDRKLAEADLLRQDSLLMAVSESSHKLLMERNIDKSLPQVLDIIGEATNQDRVYIFEYQKDQKTSENLMSERFEWKHDGKIIIQNNPEYQRLSFDQLFPRWFEVLTKGQSISAKVTDLPEPEQIILSERGITSILVVPIMVNNLFWGFAGFDKRGGQYTWSLGERAILTTLAASLGSTIERHRSEIEILNQSKLRQLLTDISSKYINIPLHLVENEINTSLKKLSEFIGADRSCIYNYKHEEQLYYHLQEWHSDKVILKSSNVNHIKLNSFFYDQFSKGEPVFIPDIHDFSALYEEEVFFPNAIKSLLAIPLMYNNTFIGFVGFDFLKEYPHYSENELQLLDVFAQMIVNVQLRKENEERLLKAKEKAEESNRLKTAFINNISHEIRTPLNGIISIKDLLYDFNASESEKREYFEILESSSRRLLNTISDYTDIAMVASGTMEVRLTTFALKKQLELIISRLKEDIRNDKLILKTNYPEEDTTIKSDPVLFEKLLIILVGNAIKFTEKGFIEVGFNINKEHILFYIKDTGKGIHKNKIEAIFNSFTQEDYSNKRSYEGSGLGLAIAKGIIDLLHGIIWVESEFGKGSVFYFKLPYCK